MEKFEDLDIEEVMRARSLRIVYDHLGDLKLYTTDTDADVEAKVLPRLLKAADEYGLNDEQAERFSTLALQVFMLVKREDPTASDESEDWF